LPLISSSLYLSQAGSDVEAAGGVPRPEGEQAACSAAAEEAWAPRQTTFVISLSLSHFHRLLPPSPPSFTLLSNDRILSLSLLSLDPPTSTAQEIAVVPLLLVVALHSAVNTAAMPVLMPWEHTPHRLYIQAVRKRGQIEERWRADMWGQGYF
jgi:hypothetical protein